MAAKGIAVIFITHRLHEILTVCDKVVIMRDGYVVKDVPAKETDVADITKWMVCLLYTSWPESAKGYRCLRHRNLVNGI